MMQRFHFIYAIIGIAMVVLVELIQMPVLATGIAYNPPKVGTPDARVGAGTRGPARGPARGLSRGHDSACRATAPSSSRGLARGGEEATESITLAVLGPGHQLGRTTQSQPTLYWGVVNACDYDDVEVILRERVNNPFAAAQSHALIDTRITGPADGIHTLDLAAQQVSLEFGKEYEWIIALVVDPENRSLDIVAQTSIERVEFTAEEGQKLTKIGDELTKANFYAQNGLWYDAVDTLYKAEQSDAQSLRQSLFRQVELPETIIALPTVQ